MIDRRAMFFFVSALVCLVIMPVLPHDPKHPWLQRTPIVLIALLILCGLLSWLDHWSRRHQSD